MLPNWSSSPTAYTSSSTWMNEILWSVIMSDHQIRNAWHRMWLSAQHILIFTQHILSKLHISAPALKPCVFCFIFQVFLLIYFHKSADCFCIHHHLRDWDQTPITWLPSNPSTSSFKSVPRVTDLHKGNRSLWCILPGPPIILCTLIKSPLYSTLF